MLSQVQYLPCNRNHIHYAHTLDSNDHKMDLVEKVSSDHNQRGLAGKVSSDHNQKDLVGKVSSKMDMSMNVHNHPRTIPFVIYGKEIKMLIRLNE